MPTMPAVVSYGTITGTLLLAAPDTADAGPEPDAVAAIGTVTFTPSVGVLEVQSANVTILPQPLTFSLDANGSFSASLIATNDPDVIPSGWSYTATFTLTNGSLSPLTLTVPSGATQDISQLISVPTSTGTYYVLAEAAVTPYRYGAKGDGVNDDRAAIQQALDTAGAGGRVRFPSGTYLLGSATLSGDRILKTYPNQSLIGDGRYNTTLKVKNTFGDYNTVIGCATDSTYCGRWEMTNLAVNQNATNGNALNIPSRATYPRMAVRLGSYTAGDAVSIHDCLFLDGDNVNTLYLYAPLTEVTRNHFLTQGGPVGTAYHDHSGIYITCTTALGTMNVSGNQMFGVQGSAGAITAIETHGGLQTVEDNNISGYFQMANLTGVSNTYPTTGIDAIGNTGVGVCIGMHVWAWYQGTLTTGVVLRNVNVNENTISIDRDKWLGLTGLTAYAYGLLVDAGNTSPIESLTFADNHVSWEPIVSANAPTGDSKSCGLYLAIPTAAAYVRGLRVANNRFTRPPSAGMYVAATIADGMFKGNRVTDPGQSTEASVATLYRSAILLDKSLTDVGFEDNGLIDTRATHYSEYNINSASTTLTVAKNCWTRNNWTRYDDAANPRAPYVPGSSTPAFQIDEAMDVASLPATAPFKVGSTIRETSTGKVYTQRTSPSGTTWVPDRGSGTPEAAVTSPVGATYLRTDGGAATTLYVKESGTGNTGWVAK
jgi:hypothetical protein